MSCCPTCCQKCCQKWILITGSADRNSMSLIFENLFQLKSYSFQIKSVETTSKYSINVYGNLNSSEFQSNDFARTCYELRSYLKGIICIGN